MIAGIKGGIKFYAGSRPAFNAGLDLALERTVCEKKEKRGIFVLETADL